MGRVNSAFRTLAVCFPRFRGSPSVLSRSAFRNLAEGEEEKTNDKILKNYF